MRTKLVCGTVRSKLQLLPLAPLVPRTVCLSIAFGRGHVDADCCGRLTRAVSVRGPAGPRFCPILSPFTSGEQLRCTLRFGRARWLSLMPHPRGRCGTRTCLRTSSSPRGESTRARAVRASFPSVHNATAARGTLRFAWTRQLSLMPPPRECGARTRFRVRSCRCVNVSQDYFPCECRQGFLLVPFVTVCHRLTSGLQLR